MSKKLLLPFLWLCALNVGAQTLNCRVLSTINAPDLGETQCLFFDRQGMMWVGSSAGLRSYDGYDFRSYQSDGYTKCLFPSNNILAITEDKHDRLWIGTRNGLVRMDRRTGQFKTYHLPGSRQRVVYTLFTARDGHVWIGTDGGLSRYEPGRDCFVTYSDRNAIVMDVRGQKSRLGDYSVKAITEDKHGNLYLGTWGNGLLFFAPSQRKFVSYDRLNARNSAYSLLFDSRGRLWIGTWGYGIVRMDRPYDRTNPGLHSYNSAQTGFDICYNLTEEPAGKKVWACSRGGLTAIDMDDNMGHCANYTAIGDEAQTVALGGPKRITTDRKGCLWIETAANGILHVNTNPAPFNLYRLPTLAQNSTPKSVYTTDGKGFWIGMYPSQLAYYNSETGQIRYGNQIRGIENISPYILYSSIPSVKLRFNGELWIATNGSGIIVVPPGQHGKARMLSAADGTTIADDYVNMLFESRDNVMWVGQRSGLSIVTPDGKGRRLEMKDGRGSFANCDVRGIIQDHKGRLWIATDNEGIIRITGNPTHPNQFIYRHYTPENGRFSLHDASTCFEDRAHRLWTVSYTGGLFIYDARHDRFVPVNREYQLGRGQAFSLNEDKRGRLWLTMGQSLLCLTFRPNAVLLDAQGHVKDRPDIRIFTREDGLGNLQGYPNATCSYASQLFFTTKGGFFSFNPDVAANMVRQETGRLLVTDFYVDDTPFAQLEAAKRSKLSAYSPAFARRIVIPSTVSKFAFEFALLCYSHQDMVRYAYKLEGYDDNWHYRSADFRRATFQNLPSGHYKLYLKAADGQGKWHALPYGIAIEVQPHWWATWWAFGLYLLLFAGLVSYGIRRYKRHLKNRNRMQMAVVFTNIAHELQTPLAVVSAAVDELRRQAPQFEQAYSLIQNNVNRLVQLIRQTLEVRKSQAGQLHLRVSEGDLGEFVSAVCHNMNALAVSRNIALQVATFPKLIPGWFDTDKVEKMLSNLISNALKYTNAGGHVRVTVVLEREKAVITVQDDGIGISKEGQKQLYTRFFDGDYRKMHTHGTGIGLSLTRDLVKLHHGEIACKSKLGEGTSFTIKLPIARRFYAENEVEASPAKAHRGPSTVDVAGKTPPIEPSDDVDDKEYRLLLVEDNTELLRLMQRLLSRKYTVLTAKNGLQALNIIRKEELDLVVTDVMMPVMDGYELVKTVKNDKDLAMLPFVMLTAKIQEKERMEAYRIGVDAYVTKPFKLEDLQLRIDSIIENRKRIKEKFSAQADFKIANEHYSSPDSRFLQAAVDCVKTHLADSDYDRSALARAMCVSESTLYNKLRALTGQSITGFINAVRMKEACQIALKQPDIPVGELAAMVGFNSPNYFTRCFKKEYGMVLKEWIGKQ